MEHALTPGRQSTPGTTTSDAPGGPPETATSGHGLWPYDQPGYAKSYDATYLTAPFTEGHTQFDMDCVARTCRKWQASAWCDVCCGTGLHLRQTPGTIKRTGIDRSKAMLEVARTRDGHDADFHCRDARDMTSLGRFDLVTSFWYGYIHQENLDEVLRLLSAMAQSVRPGGDLILGICNPRNLFEAIPLEQNAGTGPSADCDQNAGCDPETAGKPAGDAGTGADVSVDPNAGTAVPAGTDPNAGTGVGDPTDNAAAHGGSLRIQAISGGFSRRYWGYTEPGGAYFQNCIAPHPQLIFEHLRPCFAAAEWLDYPVLPASPDWRRLGLHLQNRTDG